MGDHLPALGEGRGMAAGSTGLRPGGRRRARGELSRARSNLRRPGPLLVARRCRRRPWSGQGGHPVQPEERQVLRRLRRGCPQGPARLVAAGKGVRPDRAGGRPRPGTARTGRGLGRLARGQVASTLNRRAPPRRARARSAGAPLGSAGGGEPRPWGSGPGRTGGHDGDPRELDPRCAGGGLSSPRARGFPGLGPSGRTGPSRPHRRPGVHLAGSRYGGHAAPGSRGDLPWGAGPWWRRRTGRGSASSDAGRMVGGMEDRDSSRRIEPADAAVTVPHPTRGHFR
jgi:hypothetical protein